MRRLILLIALLLALPFTVSVKAGPETGGTFMVGSFLQNGHKPVLAYTPGASIVMSTDTTKRLRFISRTGFFVADRSEEIEGATEFIVTEKYFGIGRNVELYFDIGIGTFIQIKEGENPILPSYLLEFGLNAWRFIGLSVGATITGQPGADQVFVYGKIDLLSPL